MAYFNNEQIEKFRQRATEFLADQGYTCADITVGSDAWRIAHLSGITNECYKDRDCVDAHIKTALAKIFPNAVFKDKYSY